MFVAGRAKVLAITCIASTNVIPIHTNGPFASFGGRVDDGSIAKYGTRKYAKGKSMILYL
jgi:hypothetical protein